MPEREVARHDGAPRGRRTAGSRCRCRRRGRAPARPGCGSTASTTTRAPAAVLAQRQHVVGEVVAPRDRVEHRGHLGGLLVELGTGHGPSVGGGRTEPVRRPGHLPVGCPRDRAPAPAPASVGRPGVGAAGGAHRPRRRPGTAAGAAAGHPGRHRLGTPRRGPGRLGRGREHAVRRGPTASPTRRAGGPSTSAAPWSATRSTSPAPASSASAPSPSPTRPATACWWCPRWSSAAAAARAWLTTIGLGSIPATPGVAATEPRPRPAASRFTDGALSGTEWVAVVAEAVRRIDAGALEKVVLARDLLATADEDIDVRWPLRRLAGATRCAGPSTSTACSEPPRRCWSGASAGWSPPGCWRAPSAGPGTTPGTCRSRPRWPARRRTSRSTSTRSARSPTPWPRTARR